MKAYLLLPLVLLVGILIGGLGPRSELADLRKELKEARRLAGHSGRGGPSMNEVSGLLGIERSASSGRRSSTNAPSSNASPVAGTHDQPSATGTTTAAISSTNTVAPEVDASPDVRRGEGFNDDLDRAIELWQTRVAIARNTFVANAYLNDSQAVQFDTILAAMNVRIGTTIDTFAEGIQGAETVQTEAGIRLMNDITESMVTAYDEMDESMPSGWRRRAGESFTLTDFIDPEVARPLVGVEDKLEQISP